jgi:hypothetical protein
MARDTYNPGSHVPKVVRCNAGRDEAAMYKNLGNSQRIKFLWADTITLVSGTYEAVSSGTFGAGKSVTAPDHYSPGGGYYGKDLSDLYVFATPMAAVSGTIWVNIDTSADTVTVNSTAAPADDGVEVALLYFTT